MSGGVAYPGNCGIRSFCINREEILQGSCEEQNGALARATLIVANLYSFEDIREVAKKLIENSRLGDTRIGRRLGVDKLINNLASDLLFVCISDFFAFFRGLFRRRSIEKAFSRLIKKIPRLKKYKCDSSQKLALSELCFNDIEAIGEISSAIHKKLIPTDDGKSDELFGR